MQGQGVGIRADRMLSWMLGSGVGTTRGWGAELYSSGAALA